MLRAAPAFVIAVALAACGGTATTTAPAASVEASAHASGHAGQTIEVTGVDYAFENVPATIESGTELTFHNAGEEPHEMVVFRIRDDATESIEEILEMPEEEAMELAEVVGFSYAGPGESGEESVVVEEPGRYAMLCFVPVGATVEQLDSQSPPPMDAGPPHFTQGMVAEFTVE